MSCRPLLMIVLLLLLTACGAWESPEQPDVSQTPWASLLAPVFTATSEPSPVATLITPTATASLPPLATATPSPTETPQAPTGTPAPPVRFFLQPGTPRGVPNFLKPELGCNWMGLAGQIFDLNGEPLTGLVIEVGGSLEGKGIQALGVAGGEAALGPGGYSIQLADHPVYSDGSLWMQVYRESIPVTGRIFIPTFDSCEQNLILVNLVESSALEPQMRLPLILKSSP